MRKLLSVVFLSVVILLSSTTAEAQRFTKRKQYWSIGGSINAMNYMGDITPNLNPASIDFKFTRPNIGVEVMKRMTPRVSVRGQVFWGRIKGDDKDNPRPGHHQRAQSFRNDLKEVSVMGIFDLYENRGTFLKRPDYTPYALVGLGGFYHNPLMLTGGGKNRFNSFDKEGGTSVIQAALLYGVGFRYKLAKQLDIALEMGWRLTTTDKLDGVYGEYHDPTLYGVSEGETNYANTTAEYKLHNATGQMRNKGDIRGKSGPFRNDAYLVTGFHLTYILTGKVVCPKFR